MKGDWPKMETAEITRLQVENERLRKYAADCAHAIVTSPAARERDALAAERDRLQAVAIAARNHRTAIDEYVAANPKAPSYPWPALDIALAALAERGEDE